MLKISTLAVGALVLSAGVALAQMMPAGPNTGRMSRSDDGTAAPLQSAPMPSSVQYQNQAQGRGMTTGDADNPNTVAITDEYGRKYNSRGERIGGRPLR
jgi:hypothetical protein